jgi:protein-S-isoprenylcysteine O-methyltransferase Ste14
MEIIGKPTINPIFFFSGKVSGYAIWIASLLSIMGILDISNFHIVPLDITAFVVFVGGALVTLFSFIGLGTAVRLGIPETKTSLKTTGIYRFSRNPMYLGFDLFTVAGMLYLSNYIVFIFGLYSIVIYHLIILGEEKFLANRFGEGYVNYAKKVRRYC